MNAPLWWSATSAARLISHRFQARTRTSAPRRSRSTLALLAFFACSLSAADSGPITAPAQNWVLPLFNPLGYRSLTLRGDQARLTEKDRIDVTNIRVDIFSGDAATALTTIVLSPQAAYFPSLTLASGPASVRIIRSIDGTDASGEDWTYDFTKEKVSLHHNVRVIFHQALHDFLK